MHLFWTPLIAPLLQAINARRLLEIGSDQGDNARLLLDYCQAHEGFLDIIDPLPGYDPDTWLEPWPGRAAFHRDLSLNVLPQLEPADVVLIDGDHNWYTVYHELKLIEKLAKAAARSLPLILLHDVAWPYGRRDLYYNPDTIPEGFRQPYRQRGMRPASADLVSTGGLNPHLCNSIYEHNYQNGVLTAVEDFVAEAPDQRRLLVVPGNHGLGVLYPSVLEENTAFTRCLHAITPSPPLRGYLGELEANRLNLAVRDAEQTAELGALRAHNAEQAERIHAQDAERAAHAEALAARDEQIAARDEQITARDEQITARDEQITALETERLELADRYVASEQMRQSLRNQLRQLQTEIEHNQAEIEHNQAEIEQLQAEIDRDQGLFTLLDRDLQAVMASARWQVGHRLMRFFEVLLFRGAPPLVINRMAATLTRARRAAPPAS